MSVHKPASEHEFATVVQMPGVPTDKTLPEFLGMETDCPWSYPAGYDVGARARDLEEQLVRMAHLNDQMVARVQRLEAQRTALLALAGEADLRAPFWFVVAGNATRVGQLRTDTVRKVLEG